MTNTPIEVPRDKKDKNNRVTLDIENYLIDIFSEDEEVPFTRKELLSSVRRMFSGKYGNDLMPHVNWALTKLDFNRLIKKVAPGTYEAESGPDDEYMERETGYSPEGEFSGRSYDTTKITSNPKTREDFKYDMFKAEFAVKNMKNSGKGRDEIEKILEGYISEYNFNPVCCKLAVKKYFEGADVTME
jgi:hypothetical protein